MLIYSSRVHFIFKSPISSYWTYLKWVWRKSLSVAVCMFVCYVLHVPCHICILPVCSANHPVFLLPPWRSHARLQLGQLPSCSPKRRSLVSRSLLRRTSSIVCTLTLMSRSRSSLGCRGNGSHSSRTRPKGPNPLSMRLSSLLWSRARLVIVQTNLLS